MRCRRFLLAEQSDGKPCFTAERCVSNDDGGATSSLLKPTWSDILFLLSKLNFLQLWKQRV